MALPTILQRCSASCIDSAVNKSIRPLSTEMLIRLARNVKWILLHEVPDNHCANVLKRKATGEVLAATPNILFPPGGCGAHRITRISTTGLREDDVVGDVYNIQYVCQSPPHAKKVADALWRHTQDMEVEYQDSDYVPDPLLTQHLMDVPAATTMRRYELIRGRVDHDGSFFL